MRALLIVNPHATSTTRLRRDVIACALASAVELDIVETRYRGHATTLASGAAAEGYGLVLTLGGDGTVNEAVNGLLRGAPAGNGRARHGQDGQDGHNGRPPALAPLPGGNANVFVRSLGLPADPVDAAGQVVDALNAHRCRSVGLGLADDRYFAFNSGLGIDAEVVRAVEGRRARGRSVSPALYLRMALRQFYRLTDRRHPSVMLEQSGGDRDGPLFWCTVSNTSPWTYLGRRAVSTNPQASFDSGLDVFGMRTLSTASTLRTLRQMLAQRTEPLRGRGLVARHDLAELTLEADRPVAFQIDGEYVGERERVTFRAVPHAIRVVM
ncbi:MAG: diacylglycerol/lipid kinase family protein [Streptosporangiaceae bacterium]